MRYHRNGVRHKKPRGFNGGEAGEDDPKPQLLRGEKTLRDFKDMKNFKTQRGE